MLEAIYARHSVRKYEYLEIEPEIVDTLQQRIAEINAEANLHIQLVLNEPKAFKGGLAYGSFSGVSNYLVMAGPKDDSLNERIGYYGEELVLMAQGLGLNSCWAGLTYKKIANTFTLDPGEKVVCYIALGYGESQGKQHKSKDISDVSNAGPTTPEWFVDGVKAALMAPTAVNQQKFRIDYLGENEQGVAQVSAQTRFSLVGYTQIDLGIVKLHFEIGANHRFEWVS